MRPLLVFCINKLLDAAAFCFYKVTMLITWDEPKRLANLATHKLDFAEFEAAFDFASAIIIPAKRGRSLMIGRLGGTPLVAVVFSMLGTEAMSIISLRPASKKERKLYGS